MVIHRIVYMLRIVIYVWTVRSSVCTSMVCMYDVCKVYYEPSGCLFLLEINFIVDQS